MLQYRIEPNVILHPKLSFKKWTLTFSNIHFRNQDVLEGAIFFFWNQYSNIVPKKLSATALTIKVILKKVYILWKLNKFATDTSIIY